LITFICITKPYLLIPYFNNFKNNYLHSVIHTMANFELVMPKLGESIIEATIVRWHKKEGDQVVEMNQLQTLQLTR